MARASQIIARLFGPRPEEEGPFELRLARLSRAFAKPHRAGTTTVFRNRPSRRVI